MTPLYTADIERYTRMTIFALAGFLILSIPLLIFMHVPLAYVLGAVTLVVCIPFVVNAERLIYVIIFYIIAFEIPTFKGDLYPVYVYYPVLDLCIVVLFFLMATEYLLEFRNDVPRFSNLHQILLLFLVMAAAGIAIGLLYGNNSSIVWKEFRFIAYYTVFFVAVRNFKNSHTTIILMLVVLAASLLAAFEYLYSAYFHAGLRFVTRQIHIFQLIMPFLVSALLLDKNTLRRIGYAVMLIPPGLSIVFSQTRGTWVATAIAVLVSVLLSGWVKRRRGENLFGITLALVLVAGVLIFAFQTFKGETMARSVDVNQRFETLSNLPQDPSLMMRANSYLTVFKKFREHPVLGNGLGDVVTYKFFNYYSVQNNVDSTYLTIMWKLGVVGLCLFLAIYAIFLKKAIFVFKNARDPLVEVFSIGIISAFTGFLCLGVISPILITSRYNILFAVLFAMTLHYYQACSEKQQTFGYQGA